MLSFVTSLKMIRTLLKGWFTGLGLIAIASPFLFASCVVIGIVAKLGWTGILIGFNLIF